jgi:hypothetical protein
MTAQNLDSMIQRVGQAGMNTPQPMMASAASKPNPASKQPGGLYQAQAGQDGGADKKKPHPDLEMAKALFAKIMIGDNRGGRKHLAAHDAHLLAVYADAYGWTDAIRQRIRILQGYY